MIIADRYELGERLGLGGMSTVHDAYDRRLERQVAVKLLAEHLAHDEQFIARFRREALAAARLVHPNIVQVFDFGLDERADRHYIVMERIDGLSGAEILRERGHLPPGEAVDLLDQACGGLHYAHTNGVVHRDVKPGNLLLSSDGTLKLADFGIAKAFAEESSITQVGSVLGTAAYLAPEQAAGEQVGPPADIYALGVVAYQLLSGRLPYEASSLTELALKQQREAPPLLHEVVQGVRPELAAAVDRALALEPRERYADAEEMGRALTAAAAGVAPPTAPTAFVGASTMATTALRPDTAQHQGVAARAPRAPRHPTGYPAPAARYEEPSRRGAGRALGLVLLLLALAGVGAAAVIATSDNEGSVNLREVVYDDASRITSELRELVSDNTR